MCIGYSGTDGHVTITSSVFTNNIVGYFGGGLYIDSGTDAHNNITITSSVFTNNTVGYSGRWTVHITITSSVFTLQFMVLCMEVDTDDAHNNITITSSVFTNNTVGGDGGGLYIFPFTDTHNNINITRCIY